MAKKKVTKKAATSRGPKKKTTTKKAKGTGAVDAASIWETTRKKELTTSYKVPEIDDGTYVVRLVAAMLNKWRNSGVPYIRWTFVVVLGEYQGTKLTLTQNITDDQVGNTELTQADLVAKTLNGLGLDHTLIPASDIPDVLTALAEKRQGAEVAVTNNHWTTDAGEERHNLRIYVNAPLSDDDILSIAENENLVEYDLDASN